MRNSGQDGVLFVHEAAFRNGAAMLLLNLLRWLKANSTRPSSLLLHCPGGELLSDFADVTTTWSAGEGRWAPHRLRSQLMLWAGLENLARRAEKAKLRRFATGSRPGLIYLNGFAKTNFRLIELLDLKAPVLTHVHDLRTMFHGQAGPVTPRIISATRHFIACSDAVRRYLIAEHQVPPSRVDTVHEFIPVNAIRAQRTRQEILNVLSLPPNSMLVVGSGLAGWRKGSDLFIQLARIVCLQRPNACFAWVGGGAINELEHDARLSGLSEKIRFTGEVSNPVDYFAVADLFVLTSREDPFPLVCLEAAAVAKPIICFADAGGMPEFIEDDCGYVVPYLDVEAMADRVISLLDCPASREKMGAAARRKVAERHDIDITAPRILEIIEKTITLS